MSAQPEALRRADEYASDAWIAGTRQWCEEAAAELRRLHAANLDCIAWYEAAKAQRDELLAVLKDMVAGDAEAISEAEVLGIPFPEEMLAALVATLETEIVRLRAINAELRASIQTQVPADTKLVRAARQALEALGEIEWSNNSQWQSDRAKTAITALREALETLTN